MVSGVAPGWYRSGLWPLLVRCCVYSGDVARGWYRSWPFAPLLVGDWLLLVGDWLLLVGSAFTFEGPKARLHTSLGQRPKSTVRKQFVKGQRPAPSLLGYAAVTPRSHSLSDGVRPTAANRGSGVNPFSIFPLERSSSDGLPAELARIGVVLASEERHRGPAEKLLPKSDGLA